MNDFRAEKATFAEGTSRASETFSSPAGNVTVTAENGKLISVKFSGGLKRADCVACGKAFSCGTFGKAFDCGRSARFYDEPEKGFDCGTCEKGFDCGNSAERGFNPEKDFFYKACKESALCAEAQKQISEYFAGKRKTFDLPFELTGTEFGRKVYLAVKDIPFGSVKTYGEIAKEIGTKAFRAVGGALSRNPLPLIVPCHRVVSAGGLGGFTTGYGKNESLSVKRYLLDLEKAYRD